MAQSSYYQISNERLTKVTDYINAPPAPPSPRVTEDEVIDVILADWPEGQEHQEWLDTANIPLIAKWAEEIIRAQREERKTERSDKQEFALYEVYYGSGRPSRVIETGTREELEAIVKKHRDILPYATGDYGICPADEIPWSDP